MRIAFQSNRTGGGDVYVMNGDGTGQARLTTNGRSDGDPTWSPDGARLAFASVRSNNEDVYVMNADGSGQLRVTTDPASDRSPSWSTSASAP